MARRASKPAVKRELRYAQKGSGWTASYCECTEVGDGTVAVNPLVTESGTTAREALDKVREGLKQGGIKIPKKPMLEAGQSASKGASKASKGATSAQLEYDKVHATGPFPGHTLEEVFAAGRTSGAMSQAEEAGFRKRIVDAKARNAFNETKFKGALKADLAMSGVRFR